MNYSLAIYQATTAIWAFVVAMEWRGGSRVLPALAVVAALVGLFANAAGGS